MKLVLFAWIVAFSTVSSAFALPEILNKQNRSDTVAPFIVGGEEAKRNEFPFLVNLRIGDAFCGGSLISLDFVLTAARCVFGVSPETIRVTAGDHNLNENEDTEQIRSALEVKWHEQYDEDTSANDIALIRLTTPFTQTAAVRAIELPSSDFDITRSSSGLAAGWGETEFGSTSNVLRKVNVSIIDLETCKAAYQSEGVTISDKQFCAGEEKGGKDSCEGDSGGPFICDADDTVVCGIISFGITCSSPQHPGVYVKVSSYLDWISEYKGQFTTTPPPPTTTEPSSASGFQCFLHAHLVQMIFGVMITSLWKMSL